MRRLACLFATGLWMLSSGCGGGGGADAGPDAAGDGGGADADTRPVAAAVTTDGFTAIGDTTATVSSTVTDEGQTSVTARGVCWSVNQNPTLADSHTTDGAGLGTFASSLSGLAHLGTYYVRAYATNGSGTSYGTQLTLKTSLALITTTALSNILWNSVDTGGNVLSDGGSAVTVRGVCWATTSQPTTASTCVNSGTGTGTFDVTLALTIATANAPIYIRAYATNTNGTIYGPELSTTIWVGAAGATASDGDGNAYATVRIGTQTWLAKNLQTTKFSDGTTAIPLISTPTSDWVNATGPAYSDYNDTASNSTIYGRLYNHFVTEHSPGPCPVGYNVPSDADFTTLQNFLACSGTCLALKENGTTHWTTNGGAGANVSGFTALGNGRRDQGAVYSGLLAEATFWTTSPSPPNQFYFRSLLDNATFSDSTENYRNGFAIRCVK